jgi:hypothetical protein
LTTDPTSIFNVVIVKRQELFVKLAVYLVCFFFVLYHRCVYGVLMTFQLAPHNYRLPIAGSLHILVQLLTEWWYPAIPSYNDCAPLALVQPEGPNHAHPPAHEDVDDEAVPAALQQLKENIACRLMITGK